MLFSTEKKFLFVHIPKTGGTSIKLALKPYEVAHPTEFTEDPDMLEFLHQRSPELKAKGMTFPNHIPVHAIQRSTNLSLDQFTIFSVIRSPWDRLLSLYKHYRRDSNHPYHKISNEQSFKGFIKFLASKKAPSPFIDSLPQINYLLNKKNCLGVNYLLKFEALIPALNVVCRKLDLKIELPKVNVSSTRSNYMNECDEETMQLIAKYEKDIIRLGQYTFGQEDVLPASVIEIKNVDNS